MSTVPTATERSPWPPGFSFVIITAQAFSGSMIRSVGIEKSGRRRAKQTRDHPLAQNTLLRIAAVRMKPVADDWFAIADDIAYERQQPKPSSQKS